MDTIQEILSDVNKDIKSILKHKQNRYFFDFISTAYIPEKKLTNFPEGNPPYLPTTASEHQLRGAFWQFCKKIDVLRRTDVHKLRLETILIQFLETMSQDEADIVVHMKDQTLAELYPNITLEAIKNVGFFS